MIFMENIIKFLTKNVLQNDTTSAGKEADEMIKQLKRETVRKPVIYIGTSSCGIAAGALKTKEAVNVYLKEKKIDAEVVSVGCIGACHLEPVMDVQMPGLCRISFKNVDAESVTNILDGVFNNNIVSDNVIGQYNQKKLQKWDNINNIENLPFFSGQKRILLELNGIINPESIEEFIANGGYRAYVKSIYHYTSDEVCRIVSKSGLRGRGGSGFPTGQKWKLAHETASDQRYLICNSNESDPGSFMEKILIESNPHKLIEGIAIASYAIGASKAYVYIRSDNILAYERLKNAVNQARNLGLIGENILDSGFNLDLIIKKAPGAFVCGEETAMLSSIEGRRGMPRTRPPYPAEKGLFGKPTVVNNVETLLNVPNIINNGPVWFTNIGTQNSKGTKILSLSGKIANHGLIEVEMGKTLAEIVENIGGGLKNNKKFKAIQLGGPAGSFITEQNLNLTIDYDELKNAGTFMGSGGIVVLDEDTCMVDLTKFYLNFIQHESCGKCIPCREGTQRMYEIIEKITKIPKDETSHQTLDRFKGVMQLENIADVIKDTSLCGLGKNAANTFLSSLKWFRDEYEEHIFDRKCRAGVCKELRTFYIDVEKCTGCNACMRKCPVNAIIGTVKYPHFIVESKCIGCGICFETCKFSAIYIK
jgi:NADH:ubiquinone oxidoreductase subunit F (NADH-binding)/(2Fe-2S) ferredoxin/Pyruvate/2-oxoacid:ferredoxin oxidoreductase delta subunit